MLRFLAAPAREASPLESRLQAKGALRRARALAGIATFSCHKPGNIVDVVPGDHVAAAVLTAGAALMQVRHGPEAFCSYPGTFDNGS